VAAGATNVAPLPAHLSKVADTVIEAKKSNSYTNVQFDYDSK